MNRRQFAIRATALTLAPSVIGLTGCNTSEVVNEINTVLKEAAAVLAVAEPGAAWVTQLQQAIAALMTAEQTWQAGGPVQIVDDALNTIVAVCAVIPLTAVYSPLIDVLVTAIEVVLAALPAPTTATATKLTVEQAKRATATGNPHIGRYRMKHHFLHSPAGDFKENWNEVATANHLGYAILQ